MRMINRISLLNVFIEFFATLLLALNVRGELSPAPIAAASMLKVSVESSVPLQSPVENLSSGLPTSFREGSAFAKISLVFEPNSEAEKISFDSCENDFKDGIEAAVSPGARRLYIEGGTKHITIPIKPARAEAATISSVSLLFRHNERACLKNFKLLAANGKMIGFVTRKFAGDSDEVFSKKYFERRERFAMAGLSSVVDQELTPKLEDERWVFRFRGDGTFFIFGRSDENRGAGRFSALGNYEIESLGKSRIKLKLIGQRIVTHEPWDGWICQGACEGRGLARTEKIGDVIEIERLSLGEYMVRNRVKSKSRSLPFSDIRVRPTKT